MLSLVPSLFPKGGAWGQGYCKHLLFSYYANTINFINPYNVSFTSLSHVHYCFQLPAKWLLLQKGGGHTLGGGRTIEHVRYIDTAERVWLFEPQFWSSQFQVCKMVIPVIDE